MVFRIVLGILESIRKLKLKMENTNYDSDDEMSQLEKLQYQDIPKGMFVSGWDDDADDNIEEEKNPTGKQAFIKKM